MSDSVDYSLPGSSIHGIFQARILEWAAISSPGDPPDPAIEPVSLALAGGFFITEPPGKPPVASYLDPQRDRFSHNLIKVKKMCYRGYRAGDSEKECVDNKLTGT